MVYTDNVLDRAVTGIAILACVPIVAALTVAVAPSRLPHSWGLVRPLFRALGVCLVRMAYHEPPRSFVRFL